MKLSDLKTHICNIFNQIKQWVSKNFSKMSKADKIVVIGLIGSLITIFVFVTGKNLPDFFRPTAPATTLEDSTTEGKSDKNNDTTDDENSDTNDDENNDPNNDKNSGVNIDVNIDGTIDMKGNENNGVNIVVNPTGADTNASDTKSPEKLIMSRSAYREGLNRAIGSDMHMVADYYADFNHDGNYEMFALVTTEDNHVLDTATYAHGEENVSFILGQIWFVNQDGARNISLTDSHDTSLEYWATFDIFTLGEDKFFPCIKEGFLKDTVYLWGVTLSGEPYQSDFSGYGSDILLNNHNEIELFYSTYDFYYDAETGGLIGRTYNPYYFYWDGTSFKEYGGTLVSIESLYSISGAQELLDQIYTELKEAAGDIQIKEIYYRENGVININYECKQNIYYDTYYDTYYDDDSYYNYNITLRYEDGELKIIPGELNLLREGLYHPALIELIAIFPETSFESLFGIN